jgi:hypothetical protein
MRSVSGARSLLERPRTVLAAAIAVQWLSTVVVALRAEHDGWRWGDPARSVELVGGTWALAALVLLNVLVLGPLALVCAQRIALRAGGVALGAWTLFVWVATPWIMAMLSLAPYDPTLRDRVLPLGLGLTAEPGYAAGVALLAATTLLVTSPRLRSALLAGLAVGFAVLVTPAALLFPLAAAPLLLSTLPPRALRAFMLAVAPAAVVAALWHNHRDGVAFSFGELSREQLDANLAGLREYFWSQRVLEWIPIAGAIGLARRSVPLGVLVGGWFAVFVAVEATRVGAGYENGELFRLLLPALPAYVLLAAALPLLVPTLAARLGALGRPVEDP